jgi:hypothetical protein
MSPDRAEEAARVICTRQCVANARSGLHPLRWTALG